MGSHIEVKFRDYDIFKLAICGPGKSGKTAICKRLTKNIFEHKYKPTCGADFHSYSFRTKEGKAVALLYDLAGQKQFSIVRKLLYPGTNAAAIVFDVSSRESFRECAEWIRELREQDNKLDITIVGNKTDVAREISKEDAERICSKLGCRYIETSALNGDGIGELVTTLVKSAINSSNRKSSAR
ncbi:MAG: Rab family GTPase [Candidatus Heimdallarchaeaceae archaeon]